MHARRNDGQRMSFESVIRKLGHMNRRIDILKIDCQGCEYAAMPPLFALIASGKIKVDQVLIELHHTKVGRRLRGDFAAAVLRGRGQGQASHHAQGAQPMGLRRIQVRRIRARERVVSPRGE